MRYFGSLISALLFSLTGLAQMHDPVDIEYEVRELGNNEAELVATAIMEEGWHIYSINTPDSSFLIGTEWNLTPSADFKLADSLQEPEPTTEYDPNFQETLSYHGHRVEIVQRIKKLSEEDFTVQAEFVYQTCNEATCLPPEYIDTTLSVKGGKNIQPSSTEEEDPTSENTTARGLGAEAEEDAMEIDYAADGAAESSQDSADQKDSEKRAAADGDKENSKPSRSMLTIFILSFLGGFAALLTPCVFPMIPLTVSFFTKQSKSRSRGIANAITYGLAIIVLYTLIGFLITIIFGSDALNALSTNPWLNIAFFLLLVIFAISFFGAFEITLPSSWVNKSDRASERGGFIGIFFMAFTLALVSFSCTGPIIGTLLVEAASGGVEGPMIGMFGFSLALALPFALFAAFPGWLNSLPQSGGWLNSVKVVLGFLELAFAFKFLSNADLVWDAGILMREHFLAIWIAIFLLLTGYLLGMFRMPHDSKLEKVSVFRLLMATGTLYFVIYLLPGMWGAPLKMISGFPPPSFYSEAPGGFGGSASANGGGSQNDAAVPDGAHPDDCPFQLNCFKDFEKGRAYARKVGKPILLDFTGKACVNCRRMEANVWSDPRVMDILRNDVVLISLYVDLRKKLPEEEQFKSEVTGKKVETVGNKWSEFQVRHFQSNSQPQYVILDHQSMEPLNGTTAYDPDIQKYLNWLQEGIEIFEQGQED